MNDCLPPRTQYVLEVRRSIGARLDAALGLHV